MTTELEEIYYHCLHFVENNNLNDFREERLFGEDGTYHTLDAQLFFENVGEDKILDFFNDLCGLLKE